MMSLSNNQHNAYLSDLEINHQKKYHVHSKDNYLFIHSFILSSQYVIHLFKIHSFFLLFNNLFCVDEYSCQYSYISIFFCFTRNCLYMLYLLTCVLIILIQ